MTCWIVEMRLGSAPWQPARVFYEDDEDMSEEAADALIETYRRAMPMKEYRKRSVDYDPDGPTEDIPF